MNTQIMNQVLILFAVTLIGFHARKKGYTSREVNKGITKLLLNITLPFLIVNSFLVKYSSDMLINAGKVFAYSIIVLLSLYVLGKILFFKVPHKRQSVLRFITLLSNCGFMGFPVLYSLYGNMGVFYGAVYNVAFNIFQYTFGIMLFTQKKDLNALKKLAFNPVIISLAFGFVLFVFSIQFPAPVKSTIEMVGGITTPLAMLLNGSTLAEMNIKEAFKGWLVYIVVFVRLLLVPVLILLLLKLLGVEQLIFKVLVVVQTMPAAATAVAVSEQYGGDSAFASKCIFMTTAFSVITIPLVIQLL